jgi:dephospho-CoA kinase
MRRAIIVHANGTQAHKHMSTPAQLIFVCGKMAAGKSTLARNLAARENAVLLVQDELLDALFQGEITDVQTFVQLANVATDVFGMSGRLMLRALIEGKATPQEMAELAKGLLRKKIPELQLALEGKLEQHHRFLLELQLQRLEAAERDLTALEQRIQQRLEPYATQLA